MDNENRRDIEAGLHRMELRLMGMESKMNDKLTETKSEMRSRFHEIDLKFIRTNGKLGNMELTIKGGLVILGMVLVFSTIYIILLK